MTLGRAAKPTMYRNTQFRSRLEARWAAFFDLTSWTWKYEPFDLDLWTPDFVLRGAANSVLCEVKPITWQGLEPEQILQARDLEKVRAYRTDHFDPENLKDELLILGDGPQRIGSDLVLGAFMDEAWGTAPDWAILGVSDYDDLCFDFFAQKGSFAHRMNGDWDGDNHLKPVNDNTPETAWAMAGNMTQWKGAQTYQGPIGPLLAQIARNAGEGEQ